MEIETQQPCWNLGKLVLSMRPVLVTDGCPEENAHFAQTATFTNYKHPWSCSARFYNQIPNYKGGKMWRYHGVQSQKVKQCGYMIDIWSPTLLSLRQCHIVIMNGVSSQKEFKNENLSIILSNRMLSCMYVNRIAG